MGIRAGDHDFAGFDGLAQRFKNHAGKFGEFIHEQHAVMGQTDLAGFGLSSATNDRGH